MTTMTTMTYHDLVNSYTADPREIPTSPVTRVAPKWFYAYGKNGRVYVSSGREHVNASRICHDRRLREDEFSKMLDLYRRRERGAPVSAEAQASINSSYWFGIFKDLSA